MLGWGLWGINTKLYSMNFERRKDIILKLEAIEDQFPVTEWMVNGIHIWPILKNLIFFKEIYPHQGAAGAQAPLSSFLKLNGLYKKGFQTLQKLMKLRLKQADFVFSGGYIHRVWNEQVYINRYFDPMIAYLESKNRSTLGLEYLEQKETPIGFVRIEHLNVFFYMNSINLDALSKDECFVRFLELVSDSFSFGKGEILEILKKTLVSVMSWKRFYLYIFKRVKPKYSFGLCYYNNAMYGMILAAKEMGITSVDMQHGTQGKYHAAYQFTKVPENGYNCLPNEFWCWEEESFASILNNPIGKYHKPVISGNPWVTFLSEKGSENNQFFPKDKPLILFTHQPLKPVLDDYLLETIQKTKNQYCWWIRLHPTISEKDQREIYDLLKKYNVENDVEVDIATQLPLPIILKYTSLHLSKYSGAIIEAMLTGTITIVLEGIGVKTFQSIIAQGKAVGLEHPSVTNLITVIDQQINLDYQSNNELYDFKDLVDRISKNSDNILK